jgi:hypothetical protein
LNPLFLITKGVKARKKRLAAGGGGGGGITVGTKLVSFTSKSSPNTDATVEMQIDDITNGTFYTDPNSGRMIRGTNVSDMVALANGVGTFTDLTGGIANFNAGDEYSVSIFAFLHNAGGSGTETLTASIINDTGNNLSAGNITLGPLISTLAAPYRSGTLIRLDIGPSAVAGEIIVKVAWTGGTSDTDSNVIAGTAQTSDAYYMKVILT